MIIFNSQEVDVEAGGQAGLASMETLDDSNGDVTKHQNQEDGMENIRLDTVEVCDIEDDPRATSIQCTRVASRSLFPLGTYS